MKSLSILAYDGTKQIDEHCSSNGELFAPVIHLQGQFTIEQLYALFLRELKSRIGDDLEKKRYRAVFIQPEEVFDPKEEDCDPETDESDQMFWDNAGFSIVYGSKDAYMLSRRSADNSDYHAQCLHTHYGFTAALSTESGNRPTEFVLDECEFRELILSASTSIRSILGTGAERILTSHGDDPHTHAVQLTQSLYNAFDAFPTQRRAILDLEDDVRSRMHKVERLPVRGNISVFKGTVIHGAGHSKDIQGQPGQLYVEHFRR
ncbi:MAG: hypothetical protein Greene041662_775 [Candidatus Peregrinibacteria bacterium Greene0416_62]|nr:MAG: hypothetical protein Greene041662_775 [Candidatus Peregrinibacteria bacterium Greene0416_62]TSD00192.1 MAG: hypothetical protein Greene101449_278 [Candidatus Peregrinibacteria bacterium Greene1014_49]